MKKAPLAQVQDQFKDKAGLIDAVKKLAKGELFTDRANESKGLDHVSNRKLLRLHAVLSSVQEKFGSRDKLIEGILGAAKRDKDAGLRTRLERYPTPRLWDMFRSAEKRNKVAAAPAEGAPKKKKAAPAAKAAKPAAKKPAARKSRA